MTDDYNFSEIEAKWQRCWEAQKVFETCEDPSKPKYYALIEFPYPSGQGLHVGHPRSYTALDAVARMRRMQGYNVLFPIGWDAFGLPAENFALKTGRHPRLVTEQNIERYRSQLKRLGFSFDWSREISTTDPGYYRWTQWIFLKLLQHGLAYKAEATINWCDSCRVGLANEEVVEGGCERCGGVVTRRVRSQWMLRITAYAERLLGDLEHVDFLDKIKAQQTNWIGRSEGAEITFPIVGIPGKDIRVFTTRPDTLFGATYMVLSPEHPLVADLLPLVSNSDEVEAYRQSAWQKSDLERAELATTVTGAELKGISAHNPATGHGIPVWIADYVLMSYGTGAIMAVPAHDERDWRFARMYNLPIVEVVSGGQVDQCAFTSSEEGVMVNSGLLDGLSPAQAIGRMIEHLEQEGTGKRTVQYRLRDWVFGRQRYWGEPIPMIDCPDCGWVPVPEDQLPLELPDLQKYQTTGTGESPLALAKDWVVTACPACGATARRETDTMPQWAGSSWYFLRYTDPRNSKELASREKLDYWTPVDWYNGGMEHTTLHLLYSRFWHKFLFDIGVVPTPEPYARRTSHGLILGENQQKMAKSRGNVVNPDDIVAEHGADAFRLYELFIGRFDAATSWSVQGILGPARFLQKAWSLQEKVSTTASADEITIRLVHRTIRQTAERLESLKFNTAVSGLMELVNHLAGLEQVGRREWETLILLMAPFAPHMAEELWEKCGHAESLAFEPWPEFDPALAREEQIEVPVQVNGKVRARIQVPAASTEEEITEKAVAEVTPQLAGRSIRRVFFADRKGRKLVSIVTASETAESSSQQPPTRKSNSPGLDKLE